MTFTLNVGSTAAGTVGRRTTGYAWPGTALASASPARYHVGSTSKPTRHARSTCAFLDCRRSSVLLVGPSTLQRGPKNDRWSASHARWLSETAMTASAPTASTYCFTVAIPPAVPTCSLGSTAPPASDEE